MVEMRRKREDGGRWKEERGKIKGVSGQLWTVMGPNVQFIGDCDLFYFFLSVRFLFL